MLAYALKDDSVFEDLSPRLADLNSDGRDEVLVVRGEQNLGSSLMALGVRNGRLEVLAESAPTGKQYVWLNQAGIADVDGDGRQEVLAVMQPHQNGQLVVYDYVEGRFQETQRMDDISNHVFGSRDQGMSALLDVDHDGRPDLIIPSANRLQLRPFPRAIRQGLGNHPHHPAGCGQRQFRVAGIRQPGRSAGGRPQAAPELEIALAAHARAALHPSSMIVDIIKFNIMCKS